MTTEQPMPAPLPTRPDWNAHLRLEEARPVLVLDLDETVYSGVMTPYGPHFTVRPGLAEFLAAVQEEGFQTVLWTAATHDWADAGLSALGEAGTPLTPVGALERSRCTPRFDPDLGGVVYAKRLNKLRGALKGAGLGRRDALVVDDNARAWSCALGNLAQVPAFEGSPDDEALFLLAEQLPLWAARRTAGEGFDRMHKGGWAPEGSMFRRNW